MSRHRNIRNLDYSDYLYDDDYEDDYDDYEDDYDENEEDDDYYDDEDNYDDYDEVAVKPGKNNNKGTAGATKKFEKLNVKDNKKVYTLDQFQEMSKNKSVSTPPPVNKNNNNQGSSKPKVISLNVSSSTELKSEASDSKESINSQTKNSGETKKQNIPKSGKLQDIDVLMKNDTNQSGKERLNLIVVGHVDAGKSTLMGHLLTLLGDVNERTIQKYQRDAEKIGKGSFAYAWVLDETEEERDRGVTMNVAITKFETEKREIFLLDSPGHKDFITHMITGAFQADAAILVVNAKTGDFETGFDSGGQTREHTLLIRSLGIQQIIVAVNKLDTMNWSKDRFDEIKNRLIGFLTSTAGFSKNNISFIPCSGLIGENLVKRENEDLCSWYNDNTLIQQIDSLETVVLNNEIIKKPFRMAISDFYNGGFGGANITVNGRIESGSIQIGENVLLTPSNEYAQVKSIMVNFNPVKYAITGDNVSVGITGPDILQLNSKSFISSYLNPVPYSRRFQCKIILFDIDIPITIGYPAILHHQHITEQMHFSKLIRAFNKNGTVAKEKPKCLTKNYASAIVQIKLANPICAETFAENKNLGRFVIRSEGKTIAAGVILKIKMKGDRKSKKSSK